MSFSKKVGSLNKKNLKSKYCLRLCEVLSFSFHTYSTVVSSNSTWDTVHVDWRRGTQVEVLAPFGRLPPVLDNFFTNTVCLLA